MTAITPGPNNILSTSMGALYGYWRTLPFLLGVASGFLVLMFFCFALSSMLIALLPSIVPGLKIIGALYILWLAFSVYRNSRIPDAPQKTAPLKLWNGVLLQFVNPKAVVFGIAVFSTFLAPVLRDPLPHVYLPFLLMIPTFVSISIWALAGQAIRRWLNTPTRVRVFGIILAAALVYTAIELLQIGSW